MTLEGQVCSLELAKRLKELGIKQESIFVWEYYSDTCYGLKYIPFAVLPDETNKVKWFSAFTVAELGELLPCYVDTKENHPFNGFRFKCEKFYSENIRWIINYESDTYKAGEIFPALMTRNIYDKSEANARAKMLIYLIENNLIDKEIYG